MHYPKHIIIEGLDRIGKNLLIDNLISTICYRPVIHFSKPKKLPCYQHSLRLYQESSFLHLMNMLSEDVPFIYNRSHIGEAVYSHLYRHYDGNYVFKLENLIPITKIDNIRLILLSELENAKHFKSDGDSFNDENRKLEQQKFLEAFSKSRIPDKRQIVVTDDNGQWKNPITILEEALMFWIYV